MKKLYRKINELWLRIRKWGNDNLIGYIVTGTLKILFIGTIAVLIFFWLTDNKVGDSENQNCSVAGIKLHGALMNYIPPHADNDTAFNYDSVSSEEVVGSIKQANQNPEIKAILVEVDSGGGSPLAGEEISEAIKKSTKPVVALIRGTGGSSSYWAISSASRIFASKNSSVGAIGITSSYLSSAEKSKKDGYVYEQMSSGKFKDSGSADKILTEEERALFMRDVNIMFENFISAVSQNRKIPIDKVRSFSDGSTVLGEKAKELGMIDEIGGVNDIKGYLEKTIGGQAVICWE